MFNLLWFLLIGLAAGWLASQLTGSGNSDLLRMLIVGVIGAFVGGLLIRLLGFEANSTIAELITATLGAVLLVLALRRWGP
jgi:uncharacterized membrane protein YeaQ/YmgE (transglycosylase-associated protein family)